MKKVIYLVLICMLASCNSTKKLLCRTWKIDDVTFNGAATGYSATIQDQIKIQLLTFKLDFKRDGGYAVVEKDTSILGKWWFSPDKKMVYTRGSIGTNTTKFIELTKTRMIIENSDSSGKKMTFICSPAPTTNSKSRQ